jgi:alpha-galactosidase
MAFEPNKGIFKVDSAKYPNVSFSTQFDIIGKISGQTIHLIPKEPRFHQVADSQTLDTGFGQVKSAQFELDFTNSGISIILILGLMDDLALVKMAIYNKGHSPIALDRLSFLDVSPNDLHLGEQKTTNPAFYSNGWQSWSPTRTYQLGDRQIRSKLGRFQNPMIINPGTPRPGRKNHFSSDMFGLLGDRDSRIGLLAGFLSQLNNFGSLETEFRPEPDLKMWANGDLATLPPGEHISSDWAAFCFVNVDEPEPMASFFKAAGRLHDIDHDHPVPTGWCSWYYFYQDISEKIIHDNIASLVKMSDEIPLGLCQIDDGFQKQVGDWFEFDPAFPNGLRPLAEEIKSSGMAPGLWLAPFILHPNAQLVKEHPDWLLRDHKNKPVTAGFGWNKLVTYALDLTHPDALSYACEVIRTAVHDWGFEYLKLDFLYAAALSGQFRDPTQTRAQVLRKGLEALREAAGAETTMLGCGCPLGSGLGIFEAMRIGPDVNSTWEPHFPPLSPILKKEAGMPSARNALKNTLTRAMFHHHWWVNDPDCLLIRPDSNLTLAEIQTMAAVFGMTGGSLLLSDDLPSLPADRLGIIKALLPTIGKRAHVLDWFDSGSPSRIRLDLDGPAGSWYLLALINWDNKPAPVKFSPQDFNLLHEQVYWLHEFWTGEIGKMSAKGPFTFYQVPAHGIRVLAVRPYHPEQPMYLGGDVHLSQGLEIKDWQVTDKEVKLRFNLGRIAAGNLYFYLPWKPLGAWIADQTCHMKEKGRGIYQVWVEDLDGKQLIIRG